MILTTELRLKDKAGCAYLDSQLDEEYKIFMETFRELKNPKFYQKWKTTSKFNSYLCRNYDILSRRANSLIYRVSGLLESYRANKQWEIDDKTAKVNYLEDLLEKKLEDRAELKKLARENRLKERERLKLKNLNSSVYHLRNEINELRQNIKSLRKDLKNGKYRIGIGTKKLFKKQFNLDKTNFKDHEDWKRAFEAKKSHMFFYVGRASEINGNQLSSLFVNKENGSLSLRLRKEHENRPQEKYIWFDNLNLSYLRDEVYSILKSPKSKPITTRLLKRGKKWYLQIMFEWTEPPIVTDTQEGVIAIDFNQGFLQQGELDSKGNLLGLKKRDLKHYGSGNRALNEMREQVKKVVDEAGFKLKSIAIEDLDFQLKKARLKRKGSKKNKEYNKMVSALDYHRFSEEISRCAAKNGVDVIMVPAYNTSKLAREKYCPGRCLTVHQGSTITIGRRALGFKD